MFGSNRSLRSIPVLSLATMALLSWSTMAMAVTYTISPDGSGDFPTIQAAIDTASAGDIIELTDGTSTGEGNWGLDYKCRDELLHLHRQQLPVWTWGHLRRIPGKHRARPLHHLLQ